MQHSAQTSAQAQETYHPSRQPTSEHGLQGNVPTQSVNAKAKYRFFRGQALQRFDSFA